MSDEIELIRKHYGDFAGLYDPSQAVAHVKVLLTEVLDLRALFDLQWKRSREADELWRQEDPVARANVHPDLGVVLSWLMAQIKLDRERANEAARLSAAARDANDDLVAQVEKAREQVSIVEESRSDLIVEQHRLAEAARRLNVPMVAKLRKCAADTSSNWDGKVTVYPPEARALVALIDTAASKED